MRCRDVGMITWSVFLCVFLLYIFHMCLWGSSVYLTHKADRDRDRVCLCVCVFSLTGHTDERIDFRSYSGAFSCSLPDLCAIVSFRSPFGEPTLDKFVLLLPSEGCEESVATWRLTIRERYRKSVVTLFRFQRRHVGSVTDIRKNKDYVTHRTLGV